MVPVVFDKILAGGDETAICRALVEASYDDKTDYDWFKNRCLELMLVHASSNVRKLAATCLEHVAQHSGRLAEVTVQTLIAHENDPDIRGGVETALDDWRQFARSQRE